MKAMERIYVTVRARPLSPDDAKSSPWRIYGNSIVFSNSSSKFDFDRIFGEDCGTKEVYEARTKEIVAAAVGGFNGTVFAYGQTNSGKTHTMRGSPNEPGVIPLAVRELFDIIEEVPDREFLLRMSYMEIYNEEINDLLAPEHRKLQVHESIERGIFVAGLREEIVTSPDQVLDFMEFGESHRHIGETNMNLHSSRSHTIFRMIIESRDKAGDEESGDSCDAVRVSVLNLVDLAGSERAAKTGAEGVRLKEGSHINKSLMTLGTVIKKLSEGAESQGGHVPYRDSKLTRILQPALGGNANTAIICNITLAQIHADETKSSLQFASRALRVTNCARVNEILTDAALLKRQKKEIEELRAKLQASPSDHLEEEILHLRNTLLQTELERERIALELEEEKRAQVEREKMLEDQAKKIKNLSSMVLYSSRDEIRDLPKKDKRRDTWCPGKHMEEISKETPKKLDVRNSDRKLRPERVQGHLVPFDALLIETPTGDDACKSENKQDCSISDECVLPDPSAFLKVTKRKKASQKKKSSLMEISELSELKVKYEDLLLNSEAQRIMYEVQIDCWKRQVMEAYGNEFDCPVNHIHGISPSSDVNSANTDAMHIIEQLKEQIKQLQLEKSLSDQKLERVADLAQKQEASATKQYEKLCEELQIAKEEAKLAHAEISERCTKTMEETTSNLVSEHLLEMHETVEEAQSLGNLYGSISAVNEEILKSHSHALNEFTNFKSIMRENSILLISIFDDHGKIINCLKNQVAELENEKLQLQNNSVHLMEQLENVSRSAQKSDTAFTDLSQQYESEKSELLSQIDNLEREVFSLSSSSLSREKESLRKDLEKTRAKLKETESKLKNIIQEKTRLEGERANAEREIKRLNGQKTLLERDISKRESIAGRRRDSCVDRPRAFDSKKAKGQENIVQQTLQEEYRRLEVLAFEMETTIDSLEEQLAAANQEKEELLSGNESLTSELEMLSDKLEASNTELNFLNEELSNLRSKLEKNEESHCELENQMIILVEEKEELATQLTNALLEMEEERAVWSAKEKASVEAIKDKADIYNDEITSLSSELLKVRNEMISLTREYEVLQERLKDAEEHVQLNDLHSMEASSSEIDRLKRALEVADYEKRDSEELLKSKLDALSLESKERSLASEEIKTLQMNLATIVKERDYLIPKVMNQELKSDLVNELQMIKDQLQCMTDERDKLKVKLEQLRVNDVEVDLLGKKYDDEILKAQDEVVQFSAKLADLRQKMHDDAIKNNKERTKLTMRLLSTQTKLDAFRERYKDAIDEQEFMHKKFEEASSKLKDRLASYAMEILNLKKLLAASKSN